ncbi:hypothetical protein GCM10027589_12620 [Actinocorallia lasiicapitis]
MSVFEVLSKLPGIDELRDRCRALAMLDAIMSPEWSDRYYSFDAAWSSEEEMASMRDGSGNDYSIVFAPVGVFARGFDHESPMSPYRTNPPKPWPGLFDDVPEPLRHNIAEPAFGDGRGTPRATVCFWRRTADPRWKTGNLTLPAGHDDPDGASRLFAVLADGSPETYQKFAEDYYETDVDLDAVRHILALRPLTPSILATLNDDLTIPDLEADLIEIGYPREHRPTDA